jgi:hypothetical protein
MLATVGEQPFAGAALARGDVEALRLHLRLEGRGLLLVPSYFCWRAADHPDR